MRRGRASRPEGQRGEPRRPLPVRWCLWAAAALALCAPTASRSQVPDRFLVGGGAGASYYCIVSRCDTGVILVGFGAYGPLPYLLLEGGARWQDCFDCHRFLIAEAAVQLRYPGRKVAPFVAGGLGLSSDPDFFGNEVGPLGAVGVWIWPADRWGLRVEVRGRTVGRGDALGDASLALAYRFPGRRS